MPQHVQSNNLEIHVYKCVEQRTPALRAASKAVEQDKCMSARWLAAPYKAHLYSIEAQRLSSLVIEKGSMHLHHLWLSSWVRSAFPTVRHRERCMLTLLSRSVTTSTTCKPPEIMPSCTALRKLSQSSTR